MHFQATDFISYASSIALSLSSRANMQFCSTLGFLVLSRKEYVNSRQPCNEGNYLLSMEDCKPKLHIVHCNRVSISLPSLR